MIYRLILNVKSRKYVKELGILGRHLHSYILKAIQTINPSLSQELHDRKERQIFSTHFLSNQREIRIQTPCKEVIQSLQQYILDQAHIDLNYWNGTIQEVRTKYYSEEEIMENFTNEFTLHFLTPTTFYQQGNDYPLPDPSLLFLSACKLADVDRLDPFPYSFIRKIIILGVSIQTTRVDFKKFKVNGFTGSMSLNTKRLTLEEQKWVWRLAAFGSLMGFGYKTAWGLGQTCLVPFESLPFKKARTDHASSKTLKVIGNA